MNTRHFFIRLKEIGITHWVIAPGSRSAPLILGGEAAGMRPPMVAADERSAAFIALGMAEQLGEPVAVITTSGSAAQNLGPAITEAFYRGLPLLALTADRPADRIGQEEGQSMPQPGLFADITTARFAFTGRDRAETLDAFFPAIFAGLQQGPVHINMAFQEPLYETPEVLPHPPLPAFQKENVVLPDFSRLKTSGKILVIAGQLPAKVGNELQTLLHQHHIPVLADITSNLPNAFTGLGNLAGKLPADFLPDEVWVIGRTLIWRQWGSFLSQQKHMVLFEIRPDGRSIQRFPGIPAQTIPATIPAFQTHVARHVKGDETYYQRFASLHQQVKAARSKVSLSPQSDLAFVRRFMQHLPKETNLHLANSLSVRYSDLFANQGLHCTVYSNRGVSGIDGCLSTAVGHALANPHQQHVLLIGDQALMYDNNGLWVNPAPKNLTIVVLNNQGGQIFDVIQGPNTVPGYERSFLNEGKTDFQWLAARYRMPYRQLHTPEALAESDVFQTPGLIEIQTEPKDGRRDFRTLQEW